MTVAWHIDPGKNKHALAVSIGEGLAACLMTLSFVPTHTPLGAFTPPDVLVIEKPQIYDGIRAAQGNACLDVWGAACDFAAIVRERGGPVFRWKWPAEWKAQIKKPQHHRRVWRALSADERVITARACDMTPEELEAKIERACHLLAQTGKVKEYSFAGHNLLDAVALMLEDTGRTGRAGARRIG